jgi:ribosomal protein S18 acetylase RimI-like enzyme
MTHTIPEAHPADRAELGAMGSTLAAAFAGDPVWEWLLPSGRNTMSRAAPIFEWIVAGHLIDRSVWTLPGYEATAVWAPPGRHRTPLAAVVRALPRLLRSLGPAGFGRFASLGAMEKMHPSEPHWYLALLGTHPDHQGQGLGTAVVTPGIAAADAEGVGCYLESSKEANVPYYQRLGFEVIGTYDVDRGLGPRLWLMWRDPTPPSGRTEPPTAAQ